YDTNTLQPLLAILAGGAPFLALKVWTVAANSIIMAVWIQEPRQNAQRRTPPFRPHKDPASPSSCGPGLVRFRSRPEANPSSVANLRSLGRDAQEPERRHARPGGE